MSRPLRIEAADSWYYVRNYGRKGVNVFNQQSDLDLFLALLVENCQRYSIKCHSYTLLPSEFHLLLHTKQANLARFMRQLSGLYTQNYNKKYQLNGSLFKGRYQSTLLDPHIYPLRLSIYIHQLFLTNAADTNLLSLSSYDDYLKQNQHAETMTTTEVTKQLNELPETQHYQQLIYSELPKNLKEPLNKKHLPAIIGSYHFKEKYQGLLEDSSKECCALLRMKAVQNTLDIITCTANTFRVPKSVILQIQYGAKKNSDARNMAMFLCQQHTNMTLKEIAKTFGISHYASVSNRISHFKKSLKKQRPLQQHIQQINQKLREKIITE